MNNLELKKEWENPEIIELDIKKDTFGGSMHAAEVSSSEPQAYKPDKVKKSSRSTRA